MSEVEDTSACVQFTIECESGQYNARQWPPVPNERAIRRPPDLLPLPPYRHAGDPQSVSLMIHQPP